MALVETIGNTWGRYAPVGSATVATLLLDQVTKTFARVLLPLCEIPAEVCTEIGATSWFGFVRLENGGSPLGFGQGMWIWIVLAIVGVTLVPVYTRSGRGGRLLILAAGLQLGGSTGNLVDRVLFGGATDFVRTGPVVINVADIALLTGAVIGTTILATRTRSRADEPVAASW